MIDGRRRDDVVTAIRCWLRACLELRLEGFVVIFPAGTTTS